MHERNGAVLAVNVGSSSIRLVAYEATSEVLLFAHLETKSIGLESCTVDDGNQKESLPHADHRAAIEYMLTILRRELHDCPVLAIGHRIVYGGPNLNQHQLLTSAVMDELRAQEDFDLDHAPYILDVIEHMASTFPDAMHVACFDNAFFRDLPDVAALLPIPRHYTDAGIRKNGYHGLSYTSQLTQEPDLSSKRVVMAHLGNGASVAAIDHGRPIETTMSFSPTSGIPMSSRSGDIDPSLATLLMRKYGLSVEEFNHQMNHDSGLLGMSGTSADMYTLVQREQDDPHAAVAIAKFCHEVKKTIGAYAALMGGIDALVFAGGIGEQSSLLRSRICDGLDFIGIRLDQDRNDRKERHIGQWGSVDVLVLHTDEEQVIARETLRIAHQYTNPQEG